MIHPMSGGSGAGGVTRGSSIDKAAWLEEMDRSKDTEHEAGKTGFSRNVMFTNMWSMSESLRIPWHVTDPLGTREMRFFASSQSSRVCTQDDVSMSGGDQHGECVLKSPHSRRGVSGRVKVRRCCRLGRLSVMW